MRSNIELEFIQEGDATLVFGTATCGRKFQIGTVFEPTSENPLLELKGPVGMAAVAKIVAALTGAVVMEPGMVKGIIDVLEPFAEVARHPDLEDPPGDHFHRARAMLERLMQIDCGAACGRFGIPEADCMVHDWRKR